MGTSAIDTTGSTLLFLSADSMVFLTKSGRLLLLPMVAESKFCFSRSRRCFSAPLFVKSNVAKIKLANSPSITVLPVLLLNKVSPNIFETMFTTIVRTIEMFRVKNGMGLTIVEEGALTEVGFERR